MSRINKESKIPLYLQLIDILVEIIKNDMQEGDKISSEREICKKYDVSRSTVRQAIQEMVKEGYIYKVHGKGTFVSSKKMRQDLLKFYSFTEEMKKKGKVPESKVLNFEVIICNQEISNKLNLKVGEEVYEIERLRLGDGIPMIVETSYVPCKRFPNMTKKDLEKNAMYDLFTKKYDANFTMAEEIFRPIMPNCKEKNYLKISSKIPCLMIERITYEGDNIIEYTVSIARGDKFKYRVKLKK